VTCPPHTKGNEWKERETVKSKLPVHSPKKTKALQGRKLTKPQTCVALRKKNTRIADGIKGEEYTRMKCVCEKRWWENDKLPQRR
jgi:hypothetical protein